jgi:LemA protein
VEAVKQYAGYESATLATVTELRARSEEVNAVADRGRVEKELGGQLRKLVALAEYYPDLKANQSFLDLQYNLTEVENHIQFARRYYNGAVRNLNIRIESFPDMLIARLFGFVPAQFFDFDGGQEPGDPA